LSRLIEPRLLIRAAVSLALIAFLVWRIDLHEAARALREADYVYVLPALVLFGMAKYLVAVRWRESIARRRSRSISWDWARSRKTCNPSA
jgi:uncharacterized membrane protein YbhN (UPF0104 family)